MSEMFIKPDGTPITGKRPVQVIVHAPPGMTLTAEQHGYVKQALGKYQLQDRVSLLNTSGWKQEFADGTTVLIQRTFEDTTVHVYPVDRSASAEIPGLPTFFCVPYDEDYDGTLEKSKTYFAQRWTPHGLDWLKNLDLATECTLYPPLDSASAAEKKVPSHPGNQTWFAGPDHPNKDIVLSWWCGRNRYYMNTVLESYSAPPMPSLSTQNSSQDLFTPPYSGGSTHISKFLWVNGVRVQMPYSVMSAAIGVRNGTRVIRIVSSTSDYTSTTSSNALRIFEVPLKKAIWLGLKGEAVGPSDLTSNLEVSISGSAFTRLTQPLHWNADGTKAVAIGSNALASQQFIVRLEQASNGGFIYTAEAASVHLIAADFVGNNEQVVSLASSDNGVEFVSSICLNGTAVYSATTVVTQTHVTTPNEITEIVVDTGSYSTSDRVYIVRTTYASVEEASFSVEGGYLSGVQTAGGDLRGGLIVLFNKGAYGKTSQNITVTGDSVNTRVIENQTGVSTTGYQTNDRINAAIVRSSEVISEMDLSHSLLIINTLTYSAEVVPTSLSVSSKPSRKFNVLKGAYQSFGGDPHYAIVPPHIGNGSQSSYMGDPLTDSTDEALIFYPAGSPTWQHSLPHQHSACSPDNNLVYVSVKLLDTDMDAWFVNGIRTNRPPSAYPVTGGGQGLAHPVFTGPLPPKENKPWEL